MAIVLFSGGLDSMINLAWAKQHFSHVQALYVNFGHRYAQREMDAAIRICSEMQVDLRLMEVGIGMVEHADGFIPLRNLLLIELASYLSTDIVFGMLHHECPKDKRPAFVRQMQRILNQQYNQKVYFDERKQFTIHAPFGNRTKTEMLEWFLGNHATDYALVFETIGCFSSDGGCGRCNSCFNRWIALTNCGLKETYRYSPPRWAAEQFVIGRRHGQSVFGIGQAIYRRRHIAEIFQAYRRIMQSPMRTALKLYRTKSIDAYVESLRCAT